MGENGKRFRSHRDEGDSKNQKRRVDTDRDRDRDEKSNDGLVMYRILCPDGVIGNVIGKSGKVINSIRQETRAKVKVQEPFPGAKDRVITIYCYVREKKEVEVDEEFNDKEPLCPAQDALLKVHRAIANAVSMVGEFDRKNDKYKECMILVPSSQSSNIIGKSGTTIKKLRNKTRTNIKITPKDASDLYHSCALEFDNFVVISGDSEAVKKALFAISAIMYKFSPKEDIPLDTSILETPPRIIIPSDVPIYPATGFYQNVDPIIPSRSVSSILGHANAPDIPSRADAGNTWPVYSSTLPVVSGYGGASRSEELTLKVLCPSKIIGRVIGKGGNSIKRIRQDSGAHIEVEDPKANYNECVIRIMSTESLDDLKSTAVEAVLLLQGKINNEDDDNVNLRLLVPSKVIGCIIGKSGSIINEIRKRTKADIRISKGEKPKCADANDELVEVVGEVGSLRDALIQIILRLRDDVLKDQEGGLISSAGAGFSVPSVMPSIHPVAPLGYEHSDKTESGVDLLSSRSYGSLLTGDSGYASFSSHSSSLYGLPPPSTVEMAVPAYAVGKVMGKGGMNIENIRKISGAEIEISDSKSFRGDRVALISGTPEQKRAAENLIQAFIMAT